MRRLTDDELLEKLADLESDAVERKESLKGEAPTKIREAVCAFANDLPGRGAPGVLFINASDDGRPGALSITDEVLLQLADLKTDGNILPPPTLSVEKRTLHGGELAVVTVWPSDSPPVRHKGRIWIRVGPRRAIASAQDERVLNERRRHADQPYDVHKVPSANLNDLDLRRFEQEYLVAAVAPDVLAANERTAEQRLASCKMVSTAEEPVPTVLGLLVLGHRARDFLPCAYIQFLRIDGSEISEPVVDEQVIDGPVAEVLRRIERERGQLRTAGPR